MGVKGKFSFEGIMEDFKEGGTRSNPVERTLGSIIDWLVNKYGYPVEIVGGALLVTFTQLYHDQLRLPDSGKYGDRGAQLDHYIRRMCDRMYQEHLALRSVQAIAERSIELAIAKEAHRTWRDKFNFWMHWGYWR